MGCGFGMVGIYSLHHGATKVILADINPYAVENAEINKKSHKFSDDQIMIYESDCFDNIPKQTFDVLIFNPPFNTNGKPTSDVLRKSLWDPGFTSLKKFLGSAKDYMNISSKLLIYYSDRGDIKTLEKLFGQYLYRWKLWKVFNKDQKFDNRIYVLIK